MLVTLVLEGQAHPAVDSLPTEVLGCHTFADVCAAALARVPDAPREYGMQAFLLLGSLEVPLQDPHTPARATLRTFPAATGLRFVLGPASAAGPAGGGRAGGAVRATRLAPRRERRWPQRLARIAIGVAKLVLAVEAAALLRGGAWSALRSLRRAAGWGGDSSSEYGDNAGPGGAGVGSETEAAMDAVADYVSGRGDLSALQRFDPRVIVGALEGMDTEVLEEEPKVETKTEAEIATEKYGLEAGLLKALTSKDGKKSSTEQAKQLLAQYGSAYLITSISFAIVSFAACYFAVDSGVDMAGLLSQFGLQVSDTSEKVGTFALAYAAHKALSPVRFPPTVALTPVVAKYLGKKGEGDANNN
ncbi:hypothetical protein GPECTOR_2g1600 [Gonium pectorale]|uniref:DUF1279 domain-containing protein n=1 Tax=Gonium pectorale TaxID=33097 RepID=A0A150H2I0_GONPE|nr:hypothetical protein GPECTOR_2g1600 [Gonium pectorale]|eukprot:KXZ56048.1 hypothetical protein GPECTOR_2g1600 [Gonium pectorale]